VPLPGTPAGVAAPDVLARCRVVRRLRATGPGEWGFLVLAFPFLAS